MGAQPPAMALLHSYSCHTPLTWSVPLLQPSGMVHDYSAESCKEMLDLSLKRLGVDFIDGE